MILYLQNHRERKAIMITNAEMESGCINLDEKIEEEYETISVDVHYEENILESDEEKKSDITKSEEEKLVQTIKRLDSPEQKNAANIEEKMCKKLQVQPLIIPGERPGIPGRPIGMRSPYRYQLELKVRDRPLLLLEAYSNEYCMWQPGKGRILLYVPRTCMHERTKEWYVYPAMRIFPGQARLVFNLQLTSKFRGVFDPSTLNFAENFLQIAYRRNRRDGIKLNRGTLWGYLYVHEMWEEYPTNQSTGESLYCPICERVGHTASHCRWRIENRRKRK